MKRTVRFSFKRFSLPTVRFGRFGLHIPDGSDGSICKFDTKSKILTSKSEILRSKSRILMSKSEIWYQICKSNRPNRQVCANRTVRTEPSAMKTV